MHLFLFPLSLSHFWKNLNPSLFLMGLLLCLVTGCNPKEDGDEAETATVTLMQTIKQREEAFIANAPSGPLHVVLVVDHNSIPNSHGAGGGATLDPLRTGALRNCEAHGTTEWDAVVQCILPNLVVQLCEISNDYHYNILSPRFNPSHDWSVTVTLVNPRPQTPTKDGYKAIDFALHKDGYCRELAKADVIFPAAAPAPDINQIDLEGRTLTAAVKAEATAAAAGAATVGFFGGGGAANFRNLLKATLTTSISGGGPGNTAPQTIEPPGNLTTGVSRLSLDDILTKVQKATDGPLTEAARDFIPLSVHVFGNGDLTPVSTSSLLSQLIAGKRNPFSSFFSFYGNFGVAGAFNHLESFQRELKDRLSGKDRVFIGDTNSVAGGVIAPPYRNADFLRLQPLQVAGVAGVAGDSDYIAAALAGPAALPAGILHHLTLPAVMGINPAGPLHAVGGATKLQKNSPLETMLRASLHYFSLKNPLINQILSNGDDSKLPPTPPTVFTSGEILKSGYSFDPNSGEIKITAGSLSDNKTILVRTTYMTNSQKTVDYSSD